jgi:hypothetical protein
MVKTLTIVSLITIFSLADRCKIPTNLAPNLQILNISKVQNSSDFLRNKKYLKNLCIYSISFKENGRVWNMALAFNKKRPKGAFWFLPHDNENSAFDTAIYSTVKYGGGFLAVVTGGRRNNGSIDPNRNFATGNVVGNCKPSPIFTNTIFRVINYFKPRAMPYLSLHTNDNGHSGNGGRGTISILRKSSVTKSYPAYKYIKRGVRKGLRDEDSLVYIAGTSKKPPKSKLKKLLNSGLNVKYEIVSPKRNDCSMSNFVVLGKHSSNYYNIEVEHRDGRTQKIMLDRLMKIIK